MKIKNENIGSIDPRVDEYINSLLIKAKDYELNNQSKNILNYVIYLLLNTDFQYILRSYRLGLDIPIDGFKNDKEIELWETKYREIVNNYHSGKHIDPAMKFLIDEIERKIGRPLTDKEVKEGELVIDICSNAISIAGSFIFSFLKFKDTKNVVYWLKIIYELLYFNSPEKVIRHLYKWSTVFGTQSLSFSKLNNRIKMTMILYPDTTIKDIEQLIKSKRNRISEEINRIKGLARENQSKTDDIKRDYFIYRTYMSHKSTRKRGEKIYSNISKPDAVKSKAEIALDRKEVRAAKYLEPESIRKIVSRMNKRINNAFPNSPAELNAFLSPLAPKRRTY